MSKGIGYKLMEPFDIDGGELDGISPQMCFVLGAEWWQMNVLLESGDPIGKPIHNENAERVRRMCIRRGRRFRVRDNGPEWKWLDVADASGAFPEAAGK